MARNGIKHRAILDSQKLVIYRLHGLFMSLTIIRHPNRYQSYRLTILKFRDRIVNNRLKKGIQHTSGHFEYFESAGAMMLEFS